MRGIYGKRRALVAQQRVQVGAELASVTPADRRALLEQAKVGTVITLCVVAVITAAKVLSPGRSRRN